MSAEEAENSIYGLVDNSARIAYCNTSAKAWWLRSPYISYWDAAGSVANDGSVNWTYTSNHWATRPAFNLDKSKVLFTAETKNAVASDELSGVLDYSGSGWDITLLDNSRTFDVTETALTADVGGQVEINYSGATTGANEYVSAMIVDSSDNVLYYGQIANNSESGTADLTIPSSLAGGSYTLKVFSEQINANYMTDYASAFKNIALTVEAPIIPAPTPSGGGTGYYTVKFNTTGGSEVKTERVASGKTVQEPDEPTKDGFVFDGWYTTTSYNEKYDFNTKVTKSTTLYALWKQYDAVYENPFTDVLESGWYFEAVKYAHENKLMGGISQTEFAPDMDITRAMLVTVLYRLEGEPSVNKSKPFADVNADNYFASAVIWAQQNGIVNGISDTGFAPNEPITREQLMAMLYRYAKYKGYDTSVGESTNILSYDDFDSLSEYAISAAQYTVGASIINGKTESTLNPKDYATRAELCAILQRFIEYNK